jgi:starch-binding outer membrane protein, SusD/RagB family
MYAEAKNEDTGPDESVYNTLNMIRDRADMPDIPDGLSQIHQVLYFINIK